LIVSNDSIMIPPYEITPLILKLIARIYGQLGEVKANFLSKPNPQLRKQNKIKTIHASLQIEGNTLTEGQVTAILENKRVIGPNKDILEVMNAIKVYESLEQFIPTSKKSFLNGHKLLMHGLIKDAGKYRSTGVGIMHGSQIAHLAPPFDMVPHLMDDLFEYLKSKDELVFIKSCVFHYEMEFIHPFLDGNGRMGRLWQTLILQKEYSVFEYLPVETLIHSNQSDYYKALSLSDQQGKSTPFIEYMLEIIAKSLEELLQYNSRIMTQQQRLEYFIQLGISPFTRKDYMNVFKDISSATASRDLLLGVKLKWIVKFGTKNKTSYILKS